MTPTERAKRAITDSDLEECITAAVQAERNAGDLRLADATAALQAALEDLEKCKQERDGLAVALLGFRKVLDNESDIDDKGRPNVHMKLLVALDTLHEDGLRVLAAHDRQVAARVLRREAAEWRKSSDITHRAFAAGLIDSAEEYEAGEREVPK